jgi:CheY-like chemotaxis protein
MSSSSDIARLNVLIELFSECARVSDRETLLRVAAGRLRWIIEFDQCVFAFADEADRACWVATHAEETLRRVALADLAQAELSLIERVLEEGAPAAESLGRICIPLQVVGCTLGALCFSTVAGSYTYRDMRLNELATRIRAQHSLEQRPYLAALTGYDQATDRQRSHAAGFNAHLVKPVDLALLLRVIASARSASTGASLGLPQPSIVQGSQI